MQHTVTAVSFMSVGVEGNLDLRHAGNELGKGPDCSGNLHVPGKTG